MEIPELNKIYLGDSLSILKSWPDEFIDCVVTSPPYYGLRDYGVKGQLGLEKSLDEYLEKMPAVTVELKRVLKKTGTMWWNHGDSYGTGSGAGTRTGSKQGTNRAFTDENLYYKETGKKPIMGYEKSLLLQNYRLAIRMVDEQKWILRNIIIWHKPNCMPASVKDRFTVDFEPIFFLTKSKKYWFEPQYEPLAESTIGRPPVDFGGKKGRKYKPKKDDPNYRGGSEQWGRTHDYQNASILGRNKRSIWKIPTAPYPEAHFATFPPALVETPIKAGCPEFICKKCGKAREKIMRRIGVKGGEAKNAPSDWKNIKKKPKEVASGQGETGLGGGHKRQEWLNEHPKEIIGYTDCGCNAGWKSGIVFDPFMGSGTTAYVARQLGRNYLGIELNPDYIKLAEKRLAQQILLT